MTPEQIEKAHALILHWKRLKHTHKLDGIVTVGFASDYLLGEVFKKDLIEAVNQQIQKHLEKLIEATEEEMKALGITIPPDQGQHIVGHLVAQ